MLNYQPSIYVATFVVISFQYKRLLNLKPPFKILFLFFLNQFWWVDALESGMGVRRKFPNDGLCEKIDLWVFL